jgi:hypothetical protein
LGIGDRRFVEYTSDGLVSKSLDDLEPLAHDPESTVRHKAFLAWLRAEECKSRRKTHRLDSWTSEDIEAYGGFGSLAGLLRDVPNLPSIPPYTQWGDEIIKARRERERIEKARSEAAAPLDCDE